MTRIALDPRAPAPDVIQTAAAVIRRGGVVALPTDTFYGLAADPFRAEAVQRVFAVKGRSAERLMALMAADASQIERALGPLPDVGRRLAGALWPGPLTILMIAPAGLASGMTNAAGLVGVRVPDHAVARALCAACSHPLTATSANISGEAPPARADDVEAAIGPRIDLLLDGGPTPGSAPSTIVDVSGASLRLIRAGAIEWATIEASAARVS